MGSKEEAKQCNSYGASQTSLTLLGLVIWCSIANTLGIYIEELKRLNADIADGMVRPGTQIKLPGWSSKCTDPSANRPSCRTYVVQPNDFAFSIAAGFGIKVEELVTANPGLVVGSVLTPGQTVSTVQQMQHDHARPCTWMQLLASSRGMCMSLPL